MTSDAFDYTHVRSQFRSMQSRRKVWFQARLQQLTLIVIMLLCIIHTCLFRHKDFCVFMPSAVKKAPSCGVNMKSGGTVCVSVHIFSDSLSRHNLYVCSVYEMCFEEDILINKLSLFSWITEFPLPLSGTTTGDDAAFLWCVTDIHWTSAKKVTSWLL